MSFFGISVRVSSFLPRSQLCGNPPGLRENITAEKLSFCWNATAIYLVLNTEGKWLLSSCSFKADLSFGCALFDCGSKRWSFVQAVIMAMEQLSHPSEWIPWLEKSAFHSHEVHFRNIFREMGGLKCVVTFNTWYTNTACLSWKERCVFVTCCTLAARTFDGKNLINCRYSELSNYSQN